MTFLKDSLITLTILVISIWVMPATSTDDLQILRGYCRDIFKTIGFKDDKGDYEKIDSTGETLQKEDYNRLEDDKGDHQKIDSTGKTLKQADYKKLVDIYIKMISLIHKDLSELGKKMKQSKGELGKKMKQSKGELGNKMEQSKEKLDAIYYKMEQSEVINKTNENTKMITFVPENEVTKEDIKEIKTVTTKFETDFKKYLQEKSENGRNNSFIACLVCANGFPDEPVTAFCESKIKKNNTYLMAKFE